MFALIGTSIVGAGCNSLRPSNPEAVLAGIWAITLSEPGEEDVEYEATFGSDGQLDMISAARSDGATAKLDTSDSTTVLEGNQVMITIPDATSTRVFEGTLSADGNTITGSTTEEINLGDLEIMLPAGDLTFQRVGTGDPCDGVTCEDGESCVDGQCIPDDPCTDVVCDTGESCVDGQCIPDDPCTDVVCDTGESCVDGQCIPDDPCADVVCDTGESCVDGVCLPLVGNAVAGETFYMANGCGNCHGANANDGFAPSLVGAAFSNLFDKTSGNENHAGGVVDGVTEQDAADLAAWLGSL